jgi:basic membrane protein A
MQRTRLFLMSLLAIMGLIVVACAAPAAAPDAPAASSDAGAATSEQPLRILHFVNGVLGDKSFFDSAQRGMQRAADELGAEIKTIEAGVDPDRLGSRTGRRRGQRRVRHDDGGHLPDDRISGEDRTAVSRQEVLPLRRAGELRRRGVRANKCANVYSILYKQNEGSYLAGVYAAAMTTQAIDGMNPDAVIGSIGGQEIPVILDFMVGYEQGATDTNPDIQVIRQFAGGWNDPAKGKELAKAQYSQGADIVFQIAGGTGQGVFEAAAEDGKYAIGVDSDQALIIEEAQPGPGGAHPHLDDEERGQLDLPRLADAPGRHDALRHGRVAGHRRRRRRVWRATSSTTKAPRTR